MTSSPSTATRMVLLAVATVLVAGTHLPALSAAPGTYVAVGDSFTAGPGVLNQQLHQIGCFRSDHNYPSLVARARGSALRDPSCSGAKTSDLTAPQVILGGANPPQLNSLDASVATISMQIGGNDIGFTEILYRCVALLPLGAPCRPPTPPTGPTSSAGASPPPPRRCPLPWPRSAGGHPRPASSSWATRRSFPRPGWDAGRRFPSPPTTCPTSARSRRS